MITLSDVQISFAGRTILKGVNLSVEDGECVAVVGPNGCGKSTFLRIIARLETPDRGDVSMPAQTTIGYLPQEADLQVEHSLEEELLSAFADLQAAMAEMAELEREMGRVDPDSAAYGCILRRYAELSHVVEHQEGYALEPQVRRVAAGLGFRREDLARPCSEFSGGWQMRILLAKVLLQKPDVLLLDEPTNHLDLETMLWLEEWIRACRRAVIMVSHERAFMDRLVRRIVCLEMGTADVYYGGYTDYLRQSEAKREALWDAYTRQQEEIAKIETFIRKFRYNAARASLVQSRIKQLAKIERIEPPFHPTAIHFSFPRALSSYRDVLTLENVGHSYGDLLVFSNIDLIVTRGEKIGLVGVNGAGKSTLLRIMAGRETPAEGRCAIGGKVTLAFFAQYDTETLSSDQTLLEAIGSYAPAGEAGRARDVLGAFLFTGDDVDKPLSVLSGGERTRLRLAQMLFSPANLLLLDEPTNHLDVTSRSTVEEALMSYSGTVIIVSHDPVFMSRVTHRVLEIDAGRLRAYPGSYDDYLAYKEELIARDAASGGDLLSTSPDGRSGTPSRGASPGGSSPEARGRNTSSATSSPVPPSPLALKEQRRLEREAQKTREREVRRLERAIDDVETEIERQEHRLDEMNLAMADPAIASDYAKLSPLVEEHRQLSALRQESMEKWEKLHAELEKA